VDAIRGAEGGVSAAREVLFEFVQQGAAVRVAAVDSVTGLEAVIVGPAGAPRGDLQRLALRKLERLRARAGDRDR
jgi:hypothetical protein